MSLSNVLKQKKQELLTQAEQQKQRQEKIENIINWLEELESRIEVLEEQLITSTKK